MPGQEEAQTDQEKNHCRKNHPPVKKMKLGRYFVKRSEIGRLQGFHYVKSYAVQALSDSSRQIVGFRGHESARFLLSG